MTICQKKKKKKEPGEPPFIITSSHRSQSDRSPSLPLSLLICLPTSDLNFNAAVCVCCHKHYLKMNIVYRVASKKENMRPPCRFSLSTAAENCTALELPPRRRTPLGWRFPVYTAPDSPIRAFLVTCGDNSRREAQRQRNQRASGGLACSE